jgi:hypothetical protein
MLWFNGGQNLIAAYFICYAEFYRYAPCVETIDKKA